MHLYDLFENINLVSTPAFKRWFGRSKVVDAQGKPKIVYHGTNQPIKKFDAGRLGMATQHPTAREAFFFTDSTAVANDYAQSAGERVRADISTHEKTLDKLQRQAAALEQIAQRSGRKEDWDRHYDVMQQWEDLETNSLRADPLHGQNVIPVYLRLIKPMILDAKGRGFINMGGYHTFSDAIADAKAKGCDGLIVHNLVDAATERTPATHYAVFSVQQIKFAI